MTLSERHFGPIDVAELRGSRLLTAVSYEPRFLESLKRLLSGRHFAEVTLLIFEDYLETARQSSTSLDAEAVLLYRQSYSDATALIQRSGARATELVLGLDDLPTFVSRIVTGRSLYGRCSHANFRWVSQITSGAG